ncbi:hypothetical protein EZV62_011589 [Acer yangbiense]|uniref:Uncharacterized protein n=1 Tax=Acer yangbiense TaxID=1000413 RepID=A0A5C7I661_9ROSI|nr:hypothetical protein EZV62_011589 [Acer yangbiense]
MSLSLMDIRFPPRTIPFIFYYTPHGNYHSAKNFGILKARLEKSLSEILTLYYPLAGRYVKEKLLIYCNDEGVEYAEALVDGQLSQILQGQFEIKELNRFVLNPQHQLEELVTSSLVAVQINIFNCGGLAIGLSFSHRIMDGFTCLLFTNGWAKTCKVGNITDVNVPNFESGILFPPRDHTIMNKLPSLSTSQVVTRRFVFDAKTISKLKADVMTPSTTEVLIALIWRAQINAARIRYGFLRTSLLSVTLNLRGKTFKKVPENCCGNIITVGTARFEEVEKTKMIITRVSWPNYKPFDLADKILHRTGKAIPLIEERRRAAVLPPSHAQSVPTANKEVEIPPEAEASNLEGSAGEEAIGSGSASTSKVVTRSNSCNFNNSFHPVMSMKFDIDKFDGSGDFGIWRRKVKALLSQQKILKAIEGPEKLPDSLTVEQKDDMLEMALGTIILNLSDNVLREINDEKTACDVWKKLESLYLTKSLTNKIYLKERLFGFKMDASKGLGKNLDDFKKMTIELANAGEDEKLSDENEAIILLNSLPDSFKDVKAAIKYGRSSLSLEECISALKSKELELKIEKKDNGENLFVRDTVEENPFEDERAAHSDGIHQVQKHNTNLSKTTSEVVAKRFVLDANTISKLKAEVTSSCGGGHMHKTSTTEVVTALIWRAQINAARARYGFLRTSRMATAINLRGKTFKKIPENCCGNIYTLATARFEADETKMMGLNGFVDQVRDAIRNCIAEFGKPNEDKDGFFSKLIMRPCIEMAEELGIMAYNV